MNILPKPFIRILDLVLFSWRKSTPNSLAKKTGQGIFDWSKGRPAIDIDKATDKFDPMDLIAVNVNEATKNCCHGSLLH